MNITRTRRTIAAFTVTATLLAAACGSSDAPESGLSTEPASSDEGARPSDTTVVEAAPDSTVPMATTGEQVVDDGESTPVTVDVFETFDGYAAEGGLPATWVTYGNADGGVVDVGGAISAREGQTDGNLILAWSFDANADPGFGGLRREFDHRSTGQARAGCNSGTSVRAKVRSCRWRSAKTEPPTLSAIARDPFLIVRLAGNSSSCRSIRSLRPGSIPNQAMEFLTFDQ